MFLLSKTISKLIDFSQFINNNDQNDGSHLLKFKNLFITLWKIILC